MYLDPISVLCFTILVLEIYTGVYYVFGKDGAVRQIYDQLRGSPRSILSGGPWDHIGPCASADAVTYCVFTSLSFGGDGQALSVVTTPSAASRINSPFDVAAVAVDNNNDTTHGNLGGLNALLPLDLFAVAPVPGKGLGLVATSGLGRGARVMSRTPTFAADARVVADAALVEELFPAALEALPHESRDALMGLGTHIGADGVAAELLARLMTNSFNVAVEDGDGVDRMLHAMFVDVARINHDCAPNSNYFIDSKAFTHNVFANKDISPGEEISITYVDTLLPRATRQHRLHTLWGFSCSCARCSAPPAAVLASDARMDEVALLAGRLENYGDVWAATAADAERLAALHEGEGGGVRYHEACFHAAVQWAADGRLDEALPWARRAVEHGTTAVGDGHWIVREARALEEMKEMHWSWMARERGWWRVPPTEERTE